MNSTETQRENGEIPSPSLCLRGSVLRGFELQIKKIRALYESIAVAQHNFRQDGKLPK